MLFCLLQHIEVLVSFLRKRHSLTLSKERSSFFSPWLGCYFQGKYRSFKAAKDKSKVRWDDQLSWSTFCPPSQWFQHIDMFYMPMIWADAHWVGLVVNLGVWSVEILDPNIQLYDDRKVQKFIAPVVEMLLYVIRKFCQASQSQTHGLKPFTWSRVEGIYVNERSGDCGPVSMKLLEFHITGSGPEQMSEITDETVDEFRGQYAMDIYGDLVVPLYVRL